MRTIAFDLSSGDKGSAEAIKAAVDFSLSNKDWKILGFLHGEANIQNKPDNLEIIQCSQVIEMNDGPLQVRRKSDSTLVKAIEAVLNGEADGVLSAAASGPLVTAGFLMFKAIEGTKPAFAPIFKNVKGQSKVALDIGANINVDAQTLNQYGTMGSIYAKALNISNDPIVKQLNIGDEDKKGKELQVEAFDLLSNNELINFKGNLEATDILVAEDFDVVVTEAFAGNIALKTAESTLLAIKEIIKGAVDKSFLDKIGIGVFSKKFKRDLKGFVKGVAGGAAVLGLNELLIKSHGNSDSQEFALTLQTTKMAIENELIKKIKEAIK